MTRVIRKLIVHCSATPAGSDIGSTEINRMRLQRGWAEIGYHWVIRRNGAIEAGRSESSDPRWTTDRRPAGRSARRI